MRAQSRLDLLQALWVEVSGETHLTEDHLRGSVVQRDIRELWKEVKEQERQEELIQSLVEVLHARIEMLGSDLRLAA